MVSLNYREFKDICKVHPGTGHDVQVGEQRCLLSLTSGCGWSTPRPGRFISGEETRCPLLRMLDGRLHLKCDDTRAETGFRLSAKRTSTFKSVWASVQSTTGSRGVRFRCSNAGYTMFRGSVKGTRYPLHSPVSPSLPFPRVTVCHHI
jgi:hypothetical protein